MKTIEEMTGEDLWYFINDFTKECHEKSRKKIYDFTFESHEIHEIDDEFIDDVEKKITTTFTISFKGVWVIRGYHLRYNHKEEGVDNMLRKEYFEYSENKHNEWTKELYKKYYKEKTAKSEQRKLTDISIIEEEEKILKSYSN